jgi:signal peptidase I
MAVYAPRIAGGTGDSLVRQPQGATSSAVHRALVPLQLILAFGLGLLIVALLAAIAPALVGYESFMVLSGSMEPTIKVGDLAVVGPVKPSEFKVDDIITYRTNLQPEVIVTHRVVGIRTDEDGRLFFETKGDANVVVDQVAVEQGAVLGRVAFSIPKLGYLVDFARRPEGKIALIGIPGLLLVIDHFLSSRRRQAASVQPTQTAAVELVARGRVAMADGGPDAARELFDRAIAADPHLDEAWLLKAACLPNGIERVACLQAAVTVNPDSARLQKALTITIAAAARVAG